MMEIDEKLIKEIIDKYTAKRDKSEKATDLFFEYWRIADGLKELLRLRTENKALNEQSVAVDDARLARENAERAVQVSNARLIRAHGILVGVKAMLQAQGGATHRQRDFYANAIVKMIDNTLQGIKPVKIDEEDLPF